MFFILSKILLILLVPFMWVLALFIWMLVTRNPKTKRRLGVAIVVIFVVFTNPFLYRQAAMLWQTPPVQLAEGKQYEAGILLGGMSGGDVNDHYYFGDAADRFIETVTLYHTGKIRKILITGGTGSLSQAEMPEAVFLRQMMLANKVPDSAIIIESRSRNTYENAVFSKRIIDSLHIQPPYLLITSALHMPRSEKVFRKAGYTFDIFPCDYHVYKKRFALQDTIIPDAGVMNDWVMLMKEIVGTIVYKLTGKA